MSSERDQGGEIEQQMRRDETERMASEGEMCKQRPFTAADPFLRLGIIQKVSGTTVCAIEGYCLYDR
jgi:hypothetical protein